MTAPISPRTDENGVPWCDEGCHHSDIVALQGVEGGLCSRTECDYSMVCPVAVARMAAELRAVNEKAVVLLGNQESWRETVRQLEQDGIDLRSELKLVKVLLGIYREYDLGEPPANICPLSPELEGE